MWSIHWNLFHHVVDMRDFSLLWSSCWFLLHMSLLLDSQCVSDIQRILRKPTAPPQPRVSWCMWIPHLILAVRTEHLKGCWNILGNCSLGFCEAIYLSSFHSLVISNLLQKSPFLLLLLLVFLQTRSVCYGQTWALNQKNLTQCSFNRFCVCKASLMLLNSKWMIKTFPWKVFLCWTWFGGVCRHTGLSWWFSIHCVRVCLAVYWFSDLLVILCCCFGRYIAVMNSIFSAQRCSVSIFLSIPLESYQGHMIDENLPGLKSALILFWNHQSVFAPLGWRHALTLKL